MGNTLEATVSIATADAFRNLNQLDSALTKVDKSIDMLGKQVDEAEGKAKTLAESYKKAEEQFKKTGDEADRINFEVLKRSSEDVTTRATKMREEYDRVKNAFKNFGMESAAAAAKSKAAAEASERALQKQAREAEKSADKEVAAQNKAAMAASDKARKLAEETDIISLGFNKASDSVIGFGKTILGLAGAGSVLSTIKDVLKELDERIAKAEGGAAAGGGMKVDFKRKIKDLSDNAGIIFDKSGEDRVRGLVQSLQNASPGLEPEVAATILAKGQATQYQVVNTAKPSTDGKTAGFQIAEEVAKFARRTGLDPDTAGKLFNMAQLNGVKTREDMEKMLAQIEGSFQNITFTDPREGLRTFINASAARQAQGVSLAQAGAQVAAAGVGQPEASMAATEVQQFSRVAVGTDDVKRLNLAKLAQQYGLINNADVDKTKGLVRPFVKGEHAENIRDAMNRIESLNQTGAKLAREGPEADKGYADRMAHLEFELAQLDKELQDPRKATKQGDRIREEIKEKKIALADLSRESKESASDRKQAIANNKKAISETQHDIEKFKATDEKKVTEAALSRVYAGLKLASKENLLYKATEGMTPEQIAVFASQVAEGDIAQGLIKQLTPAARKAREAALASGGVPDLEGFRKRGTGFGQSSVAQQDTATQTNNAGIMSATPQGQEFANDVASSADADIQVLEIRKAGGSGSFAGAEVEAGRLSNYNYAGSPTALRAKRIMIVARNRFARWHSTLDPRARKRHDSRINSAWEIFWYRWSVVFNPDRVTAVDRYQTAMDAVRDVGVLIDQIQKDANSRDENAGNSNLKDLPANESLTPETDPQMGGGGGAPEEYKVKSKSGSEAALDTFGAGFVPKDQNKGARDPKKDGSMGPRSDAGPSVNYNVQVGMVVSQGSQELNLPNALDLSDIGVS